MDSLKIGCFLAVAETQSFSKAADRLFKNQSVVSRQVAALEKELGVKLFIRNSRNISLTTAGQVFESGILKIAKSYESLLENTHAAEKGYRGEIKLGMHPGKIPPFATKFVDMYALGVEGFKKYVESVNSTKQV